MIRQIKTTKAKRSLRYRGIGVTPAEKTCILKINELIKVVNKLS